MSKETKLPVIGTKYKSETFTIEIKHVIENQVVYQYDGSSLVKMESITAFYHNGWEEIPTSANNAPVDRKSRITDKVQEALDKLKEKIAEAKFATLIYETDYCHKLRIIGLDLVTALEEQKEEIKIGSEPSKQDRSNIDIHTGNVDNNRGGDMRNKSIWKPISELPENGKEVIINFKLDYSIKLSLFYRDQFSVIGDFDNIHGKYDTGLLSDWCYLQDFINQVESQEERIKKLELLTLNK